MHRGQRHSDAVHPAGQRPLNCHTPPPHIAMCFIDVLGTKLLDLSADGGRFRRVQGGCKDGYNVGGHRGASAIEPLLAGSPLAGMARRRFGGKSLLEWVIRRVSEAERISGIVVLAGDDVFSRQLCEHCPPRRPRAAFQGPRSAGPAGRSRPRLLVKESCG